MTDKDDKRGSQKDEAPKPNPPEERPPDIGEGLRGGGGPDHDRKSGKRG